LSIVNKQQELYFYNRIWAHPAAARPDRAIRSNLFAAAGGKKDFRFNPSRAPEQRLFRAKAKTKANKQRTVRSHLLFLQPRHRAITPHVIAPQKYYS
jgi:hypothetical protein